MTPAERGDLAERLVPIAAGLACIVHGDGDQRDINHVLDQLDEQERIGLIVVLAGLIDPDATVADVLGYLTWDETGRTAAPTQLTKTLRDIAVQPIITSDVGAWLRHEQHVTVRIRYQQLGHHQKDIARDLGIHERTVGRLLAREVAA